ncbi:hypothetical protein Fmac_005026 [Flemingia macrophylla]|uniref:Uncharacterized protein n=1 Tax=Flemingia macrophylla TaxID=520843 RepID=A0ABD1N760_9FABA
MATYQIKSTQKPVTFSQSEIEAAKQLIQLSSGDSEELDHCSSNNSCSYSVVQGNKQPHNPESSCGDVSSLALESQQHDDSFSRTNKRYRYLKDLYSVTAPLPTVKSKKKKKKKV